ncbi:alpha/beta fold hydrolase [Nocardioides sp. CBS4Y-1]|uniref:Alpha/beta fold hydrolase n=1 Tax=Nocardioides acrostichi TaxID=2784339 RepID=A0A930Y8M4_9ACTN|nr:alpha/beta fold hydrolase [Nocardioides acrostichi]
MVLIAILAVLAVVVAGVGFAVLGLTGGSQDSSSSTSRPSLAPTSADPDATEAPDADLAPFYSQSLDWGSCDDGSSNECAELTVPVDYEDPGGATFQLALLKVPAAEPSERIGSLVVNPGGPGAPGTSYAAARGNVFRQPILDHFDLVGFDPRGTGASDPVDCLSDSLLDAFLSQNPVPDDQAEIRSSVGSLEDFFEGCIENSDDLVSHVSTAEAARDMDVLRAALGESTLTYFGASYGTKLGATYASLFPKRVGRFVLDGAVDPELTSEQLTLGQAEGFDRALTAYVTDCVDSGDCVLGDTVDAGLARIKSFLAEVDQKPLPTSDGRELEGGNAFYGLITPLYVRDYWPYLTTALSQAFGGDGSALMKLADLYASRNDDGTYSDNSAEAIYAINCLDDPSSVAPSKIPAKIPEFEKVSPTLGDVFAWSLIGCRGFTLRAEEKPPTIEAKGAAPILVVGTTRDPATPYEWAQALAQELDSGVLLTRDGDGHTGYNSGNQCIDQAVEGYLIDDEVPADGTSC